MLTVRQLQWLLTNPDLDLNARVHVVFHGKEQPSFNIVASDARQGANGDDFLIIVEEEN